MLCKSAQPLTSWPRRGLVKLQGEGKPWHRKTLAVLEDCRQATIPKKPIASPDVTPNAQRKNAQVHRQRGPNNIIACVDGVEVGRGFYRSIVRCLHNLGERTLRDEVILRDQPTSIGHRDHSTDAQHQCPGITTVFALGIIEAIPFILTLAGSRAVVLLPTRSKCGVRAPHTEGDVLVVIALGHVDEAQGQGFPQCGEKIGRTEATQADGCLFSDLPTGLGGQPNTKKPNHGSSSDPVRHAVTHRVHCNVGLIVPLTLFRLDR